MKRYVMRVRFDARPGRGVDATVSRLADSASGAEAKLRVEYPHCEIFSVLEMFGC